MKETIENNIRLLKDKIVLNNQLIDYNKEKLTSIINQPSLENRTELFTKHFGTNTELFSRNYMFIKVQFELSRSLLNTSGYKSIFGMSFS